MHKSTSSNKINADTIEPINTKTFMKRIVAWSIHLFTTSGVICALFSVVDIMQHRPHHALLWLLLAQIIDGLDGPLARKYNVRKYAPSIDGHILDLIIDYMTGVVVPVFFALQFRLYPYHGELIIASLILASSVLWYSKTLLETSDTWFYGFPAAWNLVIIVLWILKTSPTHNAVISILFIVLTLTPKVKFFHMLSSPQLRKITIPYTALAFSYMAWMVSSGRHSGVGLALVVSWTIYSLSLTIWRTLQPDDKLQLTDK